MTNFRRKIILVLLLLFPLVFLSKDFVYAQVTDNCQSLPAGQEKVSCYQKKVNELQGQVNTLSSQIAVMDNQISLTEARIAANEKQISNLVLDIDTADKKINGLQESLASISQILINRIRSTYQVGTIQPLHILLAADDATNFLSRLNYLRIAQEHDRKLILETTAAKNDYANQKNILEDKKKQIEALKKQQEQYTAQLDQEKKGKQALLAQTQGSEATYSSLLSQAKAQLAAFQGFVSSQGGASILNNQTVCDDWGCYYNQRDSQWGNNSLNGTGYTLADSGCLVTAMAMVYTHYNHKSVTPATINSNSSNFASYYPAYLNKTIVADGTTSTRIGASIDGELSAGRPVIVGVSYDGGSIPDHFVVLISGSGGNYMMNDPFTPNGHNIAFSSHYSVGSIKEIDKVVF